MLSYDDVLSIGLAPDAEALQARLVAAAAALGFGLSGGALVRGRLASRRAAVHSFGNPPAEFLEASRSLDDGLQDPLLTAMLARPDCFTYDQAFYAQSGAGGLWEHQARFGYRQGMAVSLHERSHAEAFFFGVDGPDALPGAAAARAELAGALRLVALHAHEAAKRLWTPAPAVDLNAVTAEEVEALRWAADGVAVWDAGGALVFSNPGRAQAQQQAARKLGAATGTQAVLRAIRGGLITP
ncbi:MAG: autoinducer binding domain-containing protein [Roseateles sp.]